MTAAAENHRADQSNVDAAEVERFVQLADDWWNPNGKFRPLHQIGPVRLEFICAHLADAFDRDRSQSKPFSGLRILDIGCGGGLISEPLARLGAEVTGLDPASEGIEAARRHARQSGVEIDYKSATAEDLRDRGQQFDAILCLEVLEHVPDVAALVAVCGELTKPGGALVLSTINRTLKAFALAIVGAEYILRWLPRGTHTYDKLVTPEELNAALEAAGCTVSRQTGTVYQPLKDAWTLSNNMDVNYMLGARRND